MEVINERVGEKYTNKVGDTATIITYRSSLDVDVQFQDGTIIKNIPYHNIKRRSFRNLNSPSVGTFGFLGYGKYTPTIDKKISKTYKLWEAMLRRCYDLKIQNRVNTYIGCETVKEWHNFQVFAKWAEENYDPITMEKWQLDKDILVKGNKVYGPNTCCFVPPTVNSLLLKSDKVRGEYPLGVRKLGNVYQSRLFKDRVYFHLGSFKTPEEAFQAYKVAKEEYIKEVAEKWKDQIDPKVYQALYNYKVEITD
jgi:hypothetical protein